MGTQRRRPSPHSVVGRTDEPGLPFPTKPVIIRTFLKPRTHDPPDPCDCEKLTMAEQRRDAGDHPVDPRETTGTWLLKEDPHRWPSREVEVRMAKAIEVQKLMLLEKLLRLEEKVRRKLMQTESVDTVARGKTVKDQPETRLLEQRRKEPAGNRESVLQDRRREDVKHHRSREEDKSRWKQVKDHTRRTAGHERGGLWTETGVKSRDGREHVKERDQKTTFTGNKDSKGEGEKTRQKRNDIDKERKMSSISQEETSQGSPQDARGNQSGRRNLTLASCSIPQSSRPDQEEVRPTDLQLLPCRLCNRKFSSERIEKHMQICQKLKQKQKQVFNSYSNRVKGTTLEEFLRNRGKYKTSEVTERKKLTEEPRTNTKNPRKT